ncbi:MAG: hypothetical protein J5930_06430 [Treponema sp.]|nr:hypothetical protein [Treponema sp.]MBO5607517.1 hypothetical protein [Treponema sp.]
MENNDEATAKKLWPVLCILICAAGATVMGTTLWGRQFNAKAILIVAISAAVGAGIGFLSAKKEKKGRRAALIVCVLIFAGLLGSAKYLKSDSYIVKTEWPVHTVGSMSFAYPGEFRERKLKEGLIGNAAVHVYTNENMRRYVNYMTYDFYEDSPALSSSVEGAVSGILSGYGVKSVKWSEDARITSSDVLTRFTYKVRGKEVTGIAAGHRDGSHYEIIAFYPLRDAFPKSFMEKIEANILVGGKAMFAPR